MTVLRERMIRDLEIKGVSESTKRAYLRHIRNLAEYHHKAPDQLSLEEIYQFQHYITKEKGYSFSYFNQAVCAMKFLYGFTVKKDWNINHIPHQKRDKKLPIVLSKEEIFKLFQSIETTRNRTIIYALYSAGLRVSEVVNLKISNIDSDRMVIYIDQGKGRKDRVVMLSQTLLDVLRQYWRETKPKSKTYLFPGMVPGKPLSRGAVNLLLKKCSEKAEITKRVSPHVLRHSFATHLLEDGVNIRIIQFLLGHRNLKTTSIYTHVAKNYINQTSSPLDSLFSSQKGGNNE